MKLTKKGEYALRALIDLAIAALVGRRIVRVSELAGKEKLSVKFLEQVMQQLREAGFVQSERGKFGGYRLAKSAKQISIGEVVRLIDGPLAPIGCVSQTAYTPCSCPDEAHCGLRMLMLDVRNAITGILDRYTLADVVDVTTRKLLRDGLPLPFSEPPTREPAPRSRRAPGAHGLTDGIIHQMLGDYTI